MLRAGLREPRERIFFGIVKDLAVTVLLETSFIGKFVKQIFPGERKIVPYSSQPVLILMIHEASNHNRATVKTPT